MNDEQIYNILPSARYKRMRKLARKRGLDMDLLDWGIDQLSRDIPLPTNWKDHQLKGNMDLREANWDKHLTAAYEAGRTV